jgi:hypothetical protein
MTHSLIFLWPLLVTPIDGPARDDVDYVRDIKPLLARHCVSCHGAAKPRGGLRLDTAAHALAGGDNGPSIEPGSPEDSSLYLSVIGEGDVERMPLRRTPLKDDEVARLRHWITQGARAPADEEPSKPYVHWAFVSPKRISPPDVKATSWVVNPIDQFVLAKLEATGVSPSPEADRATLIRRLSLDLIGLPPALDEVAAFERDTDPDAYERLVDRLLASPHYGERWARPWLDLARYADSNGYSIDAPRSIWKYRDWVIGALNADLPFDRFATDQLAGDLRPGAILDQLVATGFHRNTPINQEGGIDREQFRIESVMDRTSTTATVFLGLTMGCCQCHDHKYDPLSQEEYYRLFAFFNNCDEPEVPVASPDDVRRREEADAKIAAYLRSLWEEKPDLRERQHDWERSLDMVGRQKQSQEVREAFDVPFEKRDEEKNRVVFTAFIEQSPETAEHKKAIAALQRKAPKFPTTMVVRERSGTPRETRFLIQGDFTRPDRLLSPGVPAVLPSLTCDGNQANRLDFAAWLFDGENPLTARVTVNRIWQAHFGRGLVETENDFGTQGTPPSHPELLDWLASEFVRLGWGQKALHRLIVTSATYRQSSKARPDSAAIDPGNRLLARQERLRLEAELIRDSALLVSGLFTPRIGGPSVFPPQPDGVMELGQMRRQWKADDGADRYRRGLYTFLWRATPHPLLTVFDGPDTARACTRRERSNTPLQALTLLNDEAFHECARALASKLLEDECLDEAGRLDRAFRACLTRAPQATEVSRIAALRRSLSEQGTSPLDTWTTVVRVLMNLDEFICRE